MSHQGTAFSSDKGLMADVLQHNVEQSGRFSPKATAEEVAAALASDIASKIGESTLTILLNMESSITNMMNHSCHYRCFAHKYVPNAWM